MEIRLFIFNFIIALSLLLGCGGDKEDIPPQQTNKKPDIEELETIETSDIPSLYDDDELLFDDEPSSPAKDTEHSAQVKEPEYKPKTDSEKEIEKPDMGADSIDDIADELSEEDISSPQRSEKKKEIAERKEPRDVKKEVRKKEPEKPQELEEPQKPEKQIARATPPEKSVSYKPSFSKGGKYMVSLGSFTQKINAVNLQNRFKHDGYPVTIDIVSGPEKDNRKQMFYRVNIGNFATRAEAEKFGQNVVAKRGMQYWINVMK